MGGSAQQRITKLYLALLVRGLDAKSISKAASIPFIIHTAGTVRHKPRIIKVGHCPLCVYPLSI